MQMAETELENSLKNYGISYIPIKCKNSLSRIHALLCHQVLFEPQTEIEYFYVGIYYHHFVKDYDSMKKYCLEAVNLNYPNSMNNLGFYYRIIEKNHDLAEKYWLMAVNLNCRSSMYNLGRHFNLIKNYDLMKKYYLMAINLNDCSAMFNLALMDNLNANFM